jgi:hypothetical protein
MYEPLCFRSVLSVRVVRAIVLLVRFICSCCTSHCAFGPFYMFMLYEPLCFWSVLSVHVVRAIVLLVRFICSCCTSHCALVHFICSCCTNHSAFGPFYLFVFVLDIYLYIEIKQRPLQCLSFLI